MTLNPGSLPSVDLVGSQHFSLKKHEENGNHKLKLYYLQKKQKANTGDKHKEI